MVDRDGGTKGLRSLQGVQAIDATRYEILLLELGMLSTLDERRPPSNLLHLYVVHYKHRHVHSARSVPTEPGFSSGKILNRMAC